MSDQSQAPDPIVKVAVPSPLRHLFDYSLPQPLTQQKIQPGMRVLVPFGKRELIGIIMAVTKSTNFSHSLRPIISILDSEPSLKKEMLTLANWIATYYHHPIGDVIANMLPKLLQQRKTVTADINFNHSYPNPTKAPKLFELNQEQQQAIQHLKSSITNFKTFLLNGVTGSGKTEVYLQIIAETLKTKKQALVLIPEINLTPQTIARFTERFSATVTIVTLHSKLTLKERLRSWQLARRGQAAIIIGTRSAIFTPLKKPGIIIVDEEHDSSFKQQTGLRYSARDLAVVRGKLANIPVLLGSATPSLESIYNVKKGRYQGLTLPQRAGKAIQPSFNIIDMRNQKLIDGIAETLLQQIQKHLTKQGQVLIFLNRRGFAPIVICHHCGWVADCKNCDARLILHKQKNHLRCHHCGVSTKIPLTCPQCAKEKLLTLGMGTERIELALQSYFPEANIIRIDRDTTRKKDSLAKMLTSIHQARYQILIGTQMLAKGHHFPKVTMSAILNVDQSLFSASFRASEQLAQLVIQVAGRAGREELPGEVFLQTHNPHNPLLLNLTNGGYMSFVNNCLAERQLAELPPYSHLALLQAESKNQAKTFNFLNQIQTKITTIIDQSTKLFGPIPAAMERKAGYFRAQLLIQNQNRDQLQKIVTKIITVIETLKPPSSLRWFLDIDPIDISG